MPPRLIAALAAVAAACCSSRPPASEPPVTPDPPDSIAARTDAMPATTPPSSDFVPGPALTPSAPLLAWLGQQGRDQAIRLPVVITFANPGRFSIGSAHVGVAPGAPADDAIRLKLDGSGLSVALVEQVRSKCADKKQMSCALWLDGLWGPRMEGDPLGAGGGGGGEGDRHPFGVLAVGDVVDPASASTAFVAR